MKILITSILIGLSFFGFGQTKYQFAKNVFNSKKYIKGKYNKFSKKIELIDKNTYRFGNKILKLNNKNTELQKLIEMGIFNPDVIFGKTLKKTRVEIDNLSQFQKVMFNISRNDNLIISSFEQLKKLNPNPQTKRFKFWVFRASVPNPTEYYIELYNEKATKETLLNKFIENSEMSFYYQGTLII